MKFGKCLMFASACLGLAAGCSSDEGDDGAAGAGSGGTAGTGSGGAGSGGKGDPPCELGCEATLAADCPLGPPSQAECVEDCEALGSGACGSEYATLQACAEDEAITCDSSGIPVIEACSSEQDAFIACLN